MMDERFTPNDYVTVTLSEAGAEALNAKGQRLNEAFPKGPRWRTDYTAGEEVREQFWCLMKDFVEFWGDGSAMPFTDMRLEASHG